MRLPHLALVAFLASAFLVRLQAADAPKFVPLLRSYVAVFGPVAAVSFSAK